MVMLARKHHAQLSVRGCARIHAHLSTVHASVCTCLDTTQETLYTRNLILHTAGKLVISKRGENLVLAQLDHSNPEELLIKVELHIAKLNRR